MSDDKAPDLKSRRDYLTTAALVFAGGGLAAAAWPFVAQMNPNRASPAPETARTELAMIGPGQTRLLKWRDTPVMVRHRTRAEIAWSTAQPIEKFSDRLARNDNLDAKATATDGNRSNAANAQWLVVLGYCTRERCLLRETDPDMREREGVSWICPCCASRYDVAGRVVSGPAPANLTVPRYVIQNNVLIVGG